MFAGSRPQACPSSGPKLYYPALFFYYPISCWMISSKSLVIKGDAIYTVSSIVLFLFPWQTLKGQTHFND